MTHVLRQGDSEVFKRDSLAKLNMIQQANEHDGAYFLVLES